MTASQDKKQAPPEQASTDAERYILQKIKRELESAWPHVFAENPQLALNLIDRFLAFIDVHYEESEKTGIPTLFGLLPDSISIKVHENGDIRANFDGKNGVSISLPKVDGQGRADEEQRKLYALKLCSPLIPLTKMEVATQFISGLTSEGRDKLLSFSAERQR